MTERRMLNRTQLLILLILVVSCFLIIATHILANEYPYDKGSHWVCAEPEFSLSYSKTTQGDLISEEVLILNGEAIPVSIGYGRGNFTVFPKDSNQYDDRLLTGTWKYRRGKLILQIKEDFIFGNKYSELVFLPTN